MRLVHEALFRVKLMSLELPTLEGEFQKLVDAIIEDNKERKRKKAPLDAVATSPELVELDQYKVELRSQLNLVIKFAGKFNCEMPNCRRLSESLVGGLDHPKPLNLQFDAIVEMQALIDKAADLPGYDEEKQRGLELWNDRKTWPDVTFEIYGESDKKMQRAFTGQVKRYAEKTDQWIREDGPGRKSTH